MRKILFFILLSCFVLGQNKKIDSLKNELKNEKANKFLIYRSIFNEYSLNNDLENQKKIADEYYNVSLKTNDISEKAKSKILIAWTFYHKMDLENALKTLNDALKLAIESNDYYVIGTIYSYISNIYLVKNDSKNLYKFSTLSINFLEKDYKNKEVIILINNMKLNIVNMFINLGQYDIAKTKLFELKRSFNSLNPTQKTTLLSYEVSIYEYLNDHKNAISVLNNVLAINKQNKNESIRKASIKEAYFNIANNYLKLNKQDISKKYIDSIKLLGKTLDVVDIAILPYINNLKIEILIKEKKYEDAINLSDESLNQLKQINDFKSKAKTLWLKGDANFGAKNYKNSILNYEDSKNILQSNHLKSDLVDLLPKIINIYSIENEFHKLKNNLELYIKIKDEIFNEKVANSIITTQIKYETELKEAQIKSQQLELEKEKTNRNIAISGIGFLLLLSGGGFWFFKNRQKQKELQNQNTLLGLQQNLNAMELQSLNKQLDPHEIKNLLASISPEIQEKAPESYRKMLKLFNITKASLNSHSLTESIENQIKQTEDFLSLEKSMLPEPLEYSIENKIQQKDLQIPRLMLKNLVENAVKHGIKGKENGGTIKIELFEKNHFVYITVDDTGRGRKQAISSDSGIGTSTYQKLFATLNHKNKDSATFEITDKEQGTKVEVRIPKDYQYS